MADPVPTETLTLNYEKIEFSYDEAAPGDSFDFKAETAEIQLGMLLPAVQSGHIQAEVPKEDRLSQQDTMKFNTTLKDAAEDGADDGVLLFSKSGGEDGAKWSPSTEYDFAPMPIHRDVSLLLPAVQAAEEADGGYDMIF